MKVGHNPYGIQLVQSWRETTLGELVAAGGAIQTGPFGSQLHAHDYKVDGVPVVMPQQLGDNRIELDGIARISDEDRDRLSRHVMEEGDIVFSRRGDVTRRAYITCKEAGYLCGTGCLLIRLKNPDIENRFLAHFFSLPQFKEYITQKAVGATMPNLNTGILERIPLILPTLAEQRRIVEIVAAYDDLIENNRRRMALLEEAARLVYREWFVRLRFPGHEHTRIVDGVPEGPEGWSRQKLIDLCESVDYGYTASAHQEEVGPKFLRITDIVPGFIDWSAVPYCPIEEERLDKFRLREGDIVIARTGATVGYAKRLHRRHPDSVFASYLVRLRPRADVDSLILGVFVESDAYKDYVRSRVGGAAQPNANAQVLAAAEVLLPSAAIQCEFREIIEPLIDQREVLQIQNEKLRSARDLLLPRLMSGEIAV